MKAKRRPGSGKAKRPRPRHAPARRKAAARPKAARPRRKPGPARKAPRPLGKAAPSRPKARRRVPPRAKAPARGLPSHGEIVPPVPAPEAAPGEARAAAPLEPSIPSEPPPASEHPGAFPHFVARWRPASDSAISNPDRIPWGYGYTRLLLLPVDPFWCFAAWEIIEDDVNDVYRARGLDEERVRWVLRFYEITYVHWNGFNHHATFDVGIDRWSRNWYVPLWSAEKGYLADLGFVAPDGTFFSMARSNAISTPRSSPSPFEWAEWGAPDGPGGVVRFPSERDYGAVTEAIFAARRPSPPLPPPRPGQPPSLSQHLTGILRTFLTTTPIGELDLLVEAMDRSPGPFDFFYAVESLLARAGSQIPPYALRRLKERLLEWADRRFRPLSVWAGPLPAPASRPALGLPGSLSVPSPAPPPHPAPPSPPRPGGPSPGHSPGAPGSMFSSGRGR